MKNIKTLQENNQSLWIDFISRDLLQSGKLEILIKERGITGLTSNQSSNHTHSSSTLNLKFYGEIS